MTIEFRCDCGSLLRVPDRLANQVVRCPDCKDSTLVPKLGEDPSCYAVGGSSGGQGSNASPSKTAQPPSRKTAKSTYRAARMSEPPSSKAGAPAWRAAPPPRKRSQSPWLASFEFPFQNENKYTLLGWGIGFTGIVFLMTTPIPFLLANLGRFLILLIAAGYYFHFLSEIVRSAAGGDSNLPETSSGEDAFHDAITWWGAVTIGLSPWWGFQLLNWWFDWDLHPAVGQFLLLVGILYTPMALLAATLFNTVLAANPLYVLGAIFKLPLQYLTCCLLSAGVFAAYFVLGIVALAILGPESMLTMFLVHMISALLMLYVSVVVMHQLGSVYHRNRNRIGWFRD